MLTAVWMFATLAHEVPEKEQQDAGVLCEVSNQERSEGCQEHNHEEWQAGDPRSLSRL